MQISSVLIGCPILCLVQKEAMKQKTADLRLAEFDQVLVCGSWVEPPDVEVGFAELLSTPGTAGTAAVGVGTGRSHLVAGGHIGLLNEMKILS